MKAPNPFESLGSLPEEVAMLAFRAKWEAERKQLALCHIQNELRDIRHGTLTSVVLQPSLFAKACPMLFAFAGKGRSRPPPDSLIAALNKEGACGSLASV